MSENKDVNILILAPLHTALTVQMYWSNERNESDEVHELHEVNELDEVDEVESAWTVPEWSTYFILKTWSTSFIQQSEVVH